MTRLLSSVIDPHNFVALPMFYSVITPKPGILVLATLAHAVPIQLSSMPAISMSILHFSFPCNLKLCCRAVVSEENLFFPDSITLPAWTVDTFVSFAHAS
jgi:hypothetical protein